MSRSGTRIRNASSGDIDSIYAIAKSGTVPCTIESIETGLDNPGFILVAEESTGTIIGFIAVLAVADELQVLNLAVSPDFRKKGIATMLMRSSAEFAAGTGAQNCFLEVDAANLPALALYKKLGFRETGRRPKFYTNGNDAITMCSTIKSILGRPPSHSG